MREWPHTPLDGTRPSGEPYGVLSGAVPTVNFGCGGLIFEQAMRAGHADEVREAAVVQAVAWRHEASPR